MDQSLITILRNVPDIAEHLKESVKEVKKTKETLTTLASEYNEKYHDEVDEGTKRRQLLLENGRARGLTDDEILENGNFCVSKYTPILNFLYFLTREYEDVDKGLHELTEKYNRIYGHPNAGMPDKDEFYEDTAPPENVKVPPDMISYIYEHMTLDEFNKLKKLKSLSKSPNPEEGYMAYKKCLELCNRYNLNFDKLPSY